MYEYKVVYIEDYDETWQEEDFNKLAKDNWELIFVTEKYAYFIRAV